MQINAAIIHVPERDIATPLLQRVGSLTQSKIIFTDVQHKGAMWNHRRAIRWASMLPGYTMILEDDAIASAHLAQHVNGLIEFMEENTDTSIGSLYYGQGAPTDAQPRMKADYEQCKRDENPDKYGNRYIRTNRLYHAVAYVMSQKTAKYLCSLMESAKYDTYTAVDLTIQQTLPKDKREFVYCIPSPINHNPDMASTFVHMGARPTMPRVAYEFAK